MTPPIVIPPDELHIWRADLDTPPDDPEILRTCLTEAERARTDRLLSQTTKRRTTASRGALRRILSLYLGQEPSSIPLAFGPHGKPHLDAPSPLRFNVSHTGNLFICAVTSGREVGVDVERIRTGRDEMKIAERFFSTDEFRALEALPHKERTDAFYRLWARKEAVIKGDGRGFALPSDSFTVSGSEGSIVVRLADGESWRVADMEVFEGCCAAVAVEKERVYSYIINDFALT